ncbi:unnamed protein product [Penicillium salamii]|nr:unnamed protein product [Penicillium salamii]
MAAINFTSSKEVTSKRKLMRQKRCRRKTSLMKKPFEYSQMCSADVHMPGNSYPRDEPSTYLVSGCFGILGFPWLSIEHLLSNPNTSDRQGSAAL